MLLVEGWKVGFFLRLVQFAFVFDSVALVIDETWFPRQNGLIDSERIAGPAALLHHHLWASLEVKVEHTGQDRDRKNL